MWLSNEADALAGHTLVLAGKTAEALPLLRRSAGNCFAFDWPYLHVRSQLELGRVLAQTGDTPGACDAYAQVVARWGNAKPKSVTADAAREAARRLRCPK
jgi:serine/threonine-protein kinase